MMRRWRLPAVAAIVALGLLLTGCGQPVRWPEKPLFAYLDGGGQRGDIGYDTNHDGCVDYIQHIEDGVKKSFRLDTDGDGTFDLEFDRDQLPPEECRTLVVILDGIDLETMDKLWSEGHFRLFYKPAPLISSFPTVTDTGLADIFHSERPAGIEASYFDRSTGKLGGGTSHYLSGGQEAGWAWILSYRAPNIFDGFVYAFPDWLSKRELKKSIEAYYRSDASTVYLYPVASDAVAHQWSDEDLHQYLKMVDRALEQIYHDAQGRLRIFLLAPHGQNRRLPQKWINMTRNLKEAGFVVRNELAGPNDVVLPAFGMCNYVAIYTKSPDRVSETSLDFEGVEVAMYLDAEKNEVVVLTKTGRARIISRHGKYSYVRESGDPLCLDKVISGMQAPGTIDDEGYATAEAWFDATWNHAYPHPVVNVWRAFHGLVENPPDVILNLEPGYYFGQPGLRTFAHLTSTHGSLHRRETTAFFMTTEYETLNPVYLTDLSAHVANHTGLPSPFDIKDLPKDYGKRAVENTAGKK